MGTCSVCRVTFNLYGDPSLVLQGINVEGKPYKPLTPSGPSNGKLMKQYNYTTSTIDPDDDDIYYQFDWGDGQHSIWLGPKSSGTSITASYTWSSQDTYEIRVIAKDVHGKISDWSDPLIVTMPRNRAININFFIQEFLDDHPNILQILRYIFRL